MAGDHFTERAATFIDRAREARGLSDVGSGYEEGYGRFLEALDREVVFDENGRAATEAYIQQTFESRLVAQDSKRANPEYRDVAIRAPIIITGIPRSGTTALHKLMSMDPQFQGIENWLCNAPKPRPPREAWADDPDYQKSCEVLAAMAEMAPEILSEHGMDVNDVDESFLVLQQTFANNTFPSMWDVPNYDAWYRAYDETPGYRYLADALRLVGLRSADRTWLLKNPFDTFRLDTVLHVFPDARIIQTHRDPVGSLPSLVNLLAPSRPGLSNPSAEPGRMMTRETWLWAEAMRRADAARGRLLQPAVDVEFGEFVRDQMGTVARIYDAFGLVMSAQTEARMREWLADNPRREGALNRRTPEDFGMPSDKIREVYADYRAQRGYD